MAWYYQGLAGISLADESSVAWDRIKIKPQVVFDPTLTRYGLIITLAAVL